MLVCLFEPDIAQNTGSMIRLCACMGTPLHIIEPCGFPFDDKRMRRVAMDYFDIVSLTRHLSWKQFLEWKQYIDPSQNQSPKRLVLLTTRGTQSFTDFAFRPNDILLLGRESSGVPDEVRAAADASVKIPVQSGARSLNLVQAASMVLSEALRQTNGLPG